MVESQRRPYGITVRAGMSYENDVSGVADQGVPLCNLLLGKNGFEHSKEFFEDAKVGKYGRKLIRTGRTISGNSSNFVLL